MKFRLSLSLKITLFSFVLSLLGILAISFYAFKQTQNLLHTQALEALADTQRRSAIKLENAFSRLGKDLSFLAGSGPIQRLTEPESDPLAPQMPWGKAKTFWENRLAGLFEVQMEHNPDYSRIYFTARKSGLPGLVGVERGPNGYARLSPDALQYLDSTPAATITAALLHGEFYLSAIGSASSTPGQPVRIEAGTPVFTGQNELAGIIIIETDFDRLVAHYLEEEKNSRILLLSLEGKPLSITPSGSSREDLAKLQHYLDTLPLAELTQKVTEVPDQLLFDLSDEKVGLALGRFVYDPHAPEQSFIIGATASFTHLDTLSELLRNNLFLGMLAMSVSIVLLSALLISRLTRPIRQLTDAAGKISAGEKGVALRFPGNDEVAELAASLQTMVQRLDARTEQLNETYKELLHTEKLGAIGMLSASIAHEFGSPIFAIRNLLEGMKKNDNQPVDRPLIELAIDECSRLKDLIVNLRDFARPSDGTMESVDLKQLLENVLSLYTKQLEQRKIELEKKFSPSLPLVKAVPDQIKQVVLNLLSNAEKAIENADGRITIAVFAQQDLVCLSVRDNGVGIRSENLEKIFRPFFTTRKSRQGAGLGLSISYSIIKQHGGNIRVESRPGEGSTFTVELPGEQS